jgi:hypothetical protein
MFLAFFQLPQYLSCRGSYETRSIGSIEFDSGSAQRYSAITSPMPHGIPFTSPDVKR